MNIRHATFIALCSIVFAAPVHAVIDRATMDQVTESNTDLLGEQAMARPEGPTYEFFRDLLPPLRYVDANFRCYPIVLSAPSNKTKARLVSDGSSINARARSMTWSHEQGTPVFFYMGDKREPFGKDLARLTGPKFADGYLPIVQMTYESQGSVWEQETCCSTDPALADWGVAFVKITLKSANPVHVPKPKIRPERIGDEVPGVENAENAKLLSREWDDRVEAWFEGASVYRLHQGKWTTTLADADEAMAAGREDRAPNAKKSDQVVAVIYPAMITNPGRGALIAGLRTGESAYFAIFTKAVAPDQVNLTLSPEVYDQQRAQCAKTWNDILDRGTKIVAPEKVVNDAWRSTIIMDYMLTSGDAMHYSACNQYDGIYIGEGGDAIFSLGLYGQPDEARRLMPAQFKSQRKGLEFHRAAFKLQMLAKCYHLAPDNDYVKQIEPMWQKELDIILKGREKESGMLPKEQYCGDVHTYVYSLNSNANCWRALRDMSILCEETGRTEQAQQLAVTASEYRKIILANLDKAMDRSVSPPFVPVALSGEEDPHVPIWGTTMGSYWNLMIHYILSSGVFPANSETAGDVLRYVEQNGGIAMGMLRARNTPGHWYAAGPRLNDLYGLRRNLALLQRDEVDKALVGFYGKLAQGMTRDTFIGGEVTSMAIVDEFGRQISLPPNSAANSNYLQTLRYMLVQDYDMDDDGNAETLRLLYATPRAWLEDGKEIVVEKAPTQFGEVSIHARSSLKNGSVTVDVDLPKTAPQRMLLRLRLPGGYKTTGASSGQRDLLVSDGQNLDLTGLSGHVSISASVSK